MLNFLKKYKPIKEYGDEWNIARGLHEGRPMFVRVCSSLKEAVGHPDYPFQIGIAVPLLKPNQEGLPLDGELKVLGEIEDRIVDAMKEKAVFAVSVSTGGMREFILYANEWSPEEFETMVQDINKSFPSHTLQFMIQHDPKWKTFKRFV